MDDRYVEIKVYKTERTLKTALFNLLASVQYGKKSTDSIIKIDANFVDLTLLIEKEVDEK